MRRKWILVGLAVGLLAAALTGSVALAWGGPGHSWSWGRGDHEERNSAVASMVAEILGTDAEETADAITRPRLRSERRSPTPRWRIWPAASPRSSRPTLTQPPMP